MERRHFLRLVGAASIAPTDSLSKASPAARATVLYNDRVIALEHVGLSDAREKDALWVRKADLPRINEFVVKPQGACRADVCVPIPKSMLRGAYFDLAAFAKKLGQSVVSDTAARVWSFGEIPLVTGAFLESRVAPDFSVPDRRGRQINLSSFRGKKVLVVTWASW
jgi:hypothetical protein